MSKFEYKINDYRITKISTNFDEIEEGPHQISLDVSFNILVPNDESSNECIVIIIPTFSDENGNVLVSLTSKAKLDALQYEKRSELSKLISEQAVPEIYTKLRKSFENLMSISQIDFIDLPLYNDFQ